MRKDVREKLLMVPSVEDIQRGCKRVTCSNSYTKEHKILLMKLRKLLEPEEAKKNAERLQRLASFWFLFMRACQPFKYLSPLPE